jgi:alkanesulfonate monooxygenase SsuD/methylene tetrahydromethanopterin reductase-like flavin-dependent oxidoreductase (luciferase family)
MRVGVSLTSRHVGTNPRQAARFMVERAAAARKAGLDSLFVGDHHCTPAPYYQNVPMMGRLLAEWDDKPAGCLFLLPLWNPVLVAEQIGTLAAIAQGRFIMQCGLGADEAQFLSMGANIKHRPSAFEESLDTIRRLSAGETVTSNGRFTFENARVAPGPIEPLEVWIGASAKPAIDRAARLGDGWLASPGLTENEARTQAAYYTQRCAAHNRTPTAIAIRRDIYVGESQSDAEATLKSAIAAGYRGFDSTALISGTVEDVAAKFRGLAAIGYTDVIIRHLTNDQPKVLASFSRLADVRKALAQ